MAVTFVCGFECRLIAAGAANAPAEVHWNTFNNAPAISTTIKRTGAASGRVNPAATTRYWGRALATGTRTVAGRIYFRVEAMPAGTLSILGLVNASGSVNLRLNGTTGQLLWDIGAGSDTNFDSPITTGTWYRVDFLADSTGANTTVLAKLDGGTEASYSFAQAAADFTDVRVGLTAASSSTDIYYDDIVIGDATGDYPFGAGTVEGLVPTADGTHSFTAGDFAYDTAGGNVAVGATDVFGKLDEGDMTVTTDLIRQAVVRSTGYVEVGGWSPVSGADPQGVVVVLSMHSSTTGANTAGWKANDGGTIVAINNAGGTGLTDISNTTISQISRTFAARPAGGAWTLSALTNLKIRFGYSTDVVGIPYWDAVMLEVAFPDAGGTTHAGALSVSGTGALGNAGSATYAGADSVTGTGALGQSGGVVRAGSLALTGTGTLGQSGGILRAGSLAVAGAGSFGANGVLTLGGALAVTGTGTVTRNGTMTYAGVLAVTGTGAYGQVPTAVYAGALALSGIGTLGANGGIVRAGSLSVTGTGALGATPSITFGGALSMLGTGTLGQADTGLYAGSLALTGSGALRQTAGVVRGGSAALTGTGLLGASGGVTAAGALSLTGTANVTRNGTVAYAGSLAMVGTGALGQNGVLVGQSSSIALTGTGAITFVGSVTRAGSLAIAGAGTFTQAGGVIRAGALSSSGTGSLVQAGGVRLAGVLAPLGTGTLLLVAELRRLGVLALLGTGTIEQNGDYSAAYSPLDPGATGGVTLGGLSGTVRLDRSSVEVSPLLRGRVTVEGEPKVTVG